MEEQKQYLAWCEGCRCPIQEGRFVSFSKYCLCTDCVAWLMKERSNSYEWELRLNKAKMINKRKAKAEEQKP